MKKRMLSLVLVLALALSLSAPALAATYTDISSHWAKTYLETLVQKGILSGYSDGTMKPDNNISACETLVLLSRLYTLSSTEKALIADDYAAEVKTDVPSTYSWAYENLEICRAAGIVTKDELKSLSLGSDLKKEELAVFIVRAMRYTDEADKLTVKDMSFADAAKVSKNCIGSVAELAKLGILTGDEKKNVSPQASVTRAVVAAMVCRAIDTLQKAGTSTLTIDAYKGITKSEGVIRAASAGSISFCGLDGMTRDYAISSDAAVTSNGTAKTPDSSFVGCHAVLTLKDGIVTALAADSDSASKWIQGTVTSVITSGSGSITMKNASGVYTSYVCSAATTYTVNGAASRLTALTANAFATLKVTNDTVTQVTAVSKLSDLSGTVTEMTYGAAVTMKMTDSTGALYSFSFDFNALPTILRGGKTVTIDRVDKGSAVSLSFDGGKVSAITLSGTAKTLTGELTSATTTLTGTSWTVTADGSSYTFALDEDANAYSGTTAIALSSIRVGDQLKLAVFGSTVTDVWQVTAVGSSTKVTGSVLKVDASAKQITILTPANKLVYISTAAVGSYVVGSTGAAGSLSSVAVNAQITAYGSYANSRSFTAKSIVIE